jgi:UDP:flavonoid glycosyltransferase YjiC (YdhE family)
VLYYALGGGHGHALRGLAVLRALGRGRLLGPARLADWAAAADVAFVAAPAEGVGEFLARLPPPRLLLVDVFPRGVTGELTPLLERAPAWLVSRWVRPDFYLSAPVREAIESRYERILWAEAPHPALRGLRVPQRDVGPVVLDVDRLPRDDARRELGVLDDRPLLLGLGSGGAERQVLTLRLLAKVAARLGTALRFVSDALPAAGPVVRLFPAARWLAAADVLVTAAGYHAVHEARAAGVPTVYVPQARRHDDQFRRAAGEAVAAGPEELERAVHALLGSQRLTCRPRGEGARRVARLVERRVQQGVLREEQVAAMA